MKTFEKIRKELFYGLSRYTKIMPDFFVPERLEILSPRKGYQFLDKVAKSIQEEEEIIVYVHLPFCVSECTFCNTFPHPADGDVQNAYLSHLLQEIDLVASRGIFQGKRLSCLYFGGGTPTAFPAGDLRRVAEAILSRIPKAPDFDFTVESRPVPPLSDDYIGVLKHAGATRISLGCQTFDAPVLRHCGRQHRPEEVASAIACAHDAGMKVNIDMMLGLPGQSPAGVRSDLHILDGLGNDSVEYIRHEIVNRKVMDIYKRDPGLLTDDDSLYDMVKITQDWIEERGFEQNGRFTGPAAFPYRYHWLRERPLLAFGSRARSYAGGLCWENHDNLHLYFNMCDAGFAAIGRTLESTPRERMFRSLYLGLQLASGVERPAFVARYGTDPLALFPAPLKRLEELGCIEIEDCRIALSRPGRYYVEDLCCYLVDTELKSNYGDIRRSPHSSGTLFPPAE